MAAHSLGSHALPLTLARAAAWSLLLGGWLGMGSFALVLAPSRLAAFALVALWLLVLGLAAAVATRDGLRAWVRRAGLLVCAAIAVVALAWSTRGGAMTALVTAVIAWGVLTALASGVVRSLRLARPWRPGPPIGAASLGALCAGLAIGDPGDLQALALRLSTLVMLVSAGLAVLQPADAASQPPRRCRAGLFDCSLPAWPKGAWRDLRQWPALLAGLAMLPMMAALPLLAAWCRTQALAPQLMVALHLGAMFVPALVLRHSIASWSTRRLSTMCALCLGAGAAVAVWAPAPLDLTGVALAHGAAWGLAWAGQLWAPDRRAGQGASSLRAAIGYAALTIAFGVLVDRYGVRGVTGAHAALGLAAILAWGFGAMRGAWVRSHRDAGVELPARRVGPR
ncbi:MAG TPA: hypothetical protein VN680_16000 [Burkholderiaceae bacterium]|nr:hypothetical protein [Burkholderiaceae bacterium]